MSRGLRRCHLGEKLLLIAAVVLFAPAFCRYSSAQVVLNGVVGGADSSADRPAEKVIPLVNADEELAGYLAEAQRLIEQGEHGRAIQILQALILRSDSGFLVLPDGRRFVSMQVMANEALGRMDGDGMRLYRRLYDGQASQLYQQGISAGSERPLRRVTRCYRHTTFGPKALAALGAMYFDRGRFVQAGRCWREVLEMKPTDVSEAMLLGKIALAYHLGGDSARSDLAVKRLKSDHAGATAVLAGRQQNIFEFVTRIRSTSADQVAPLRRHAGWPGLGALPGGIGVMDDCDVVLVPRWRRPPTEQAGEALVPPTMPMLTAQRQLTAKMQKGRLRVRAVSGRTMSDLVWPAMVHPIVVDDVVIYRHEDDVRACDLLTGQEIWRSLKLPLFRESTSTSGRYYSPSIIRVDDLGRYALTAADGKVFALANFDSPAGRYRHTMMFGRGGGPRQLESSELAALSIEGEGSLLWLIGNGKGDDELVRNGKFLGAPAYCAGRLFVVSLYLQAYHLLCLDADTGALVWKSTIAQTPVLPGRFVAASNDSLNLGTIPTVAEGRVFVVTNAGVVAAFESHTGQAVWAYQYDGGFKNTASIRRYVKPGSTYPPPNPIIVADGRLICLPADGNNLLALAAEDGRLLWQRDRKGHRNLTAIDAGRMLMSGPGLVVVAADNGNELFTSGEELDISGRPAVTPTSVLASGDGRIYRLDLASNELTSIELADADGLLGNLVGVGGKLIAANTAGLCAYFEYDVARKELAERIRSASPADRPELLYHWARFAFKSGRFAQALEHFQQCTEQAEQHSRADLVEQVRPWLLMTYVALGNQAETPQRMGQMFKKAEAYAETNQEKAHMMIRLAKYHENIGESALAVQIAQKLSEDYSDEQLVNVGIGEQAEGPGPFGSELDRINAKVLAQGLVRKWIVKHGRDIYARFDALAEAAFEKALAASDAAGLLDVAARWPHSDRADDALFAAAEIFYRRAAADEGPQAEQLLGQAKRYLSAVGHSDSPLRPAANAALAMIWLRQGYNPTANLICREIQDREGFSPDVQVSFASIQGTLGDILRKIQAAGSAGRRRRMKFISAVDAPVHNVFTIEGRSAYILRDQEFRPIRLGQKILVLQGDRIVMLDSSADDAESAMGGWTGVMPADDDGGGNVGQIQSGLTLVAGLSRDRKIVAVTDKKTITAFDVQTAKQRWKTNASDLGIAQVRWISTGAGRMVLTDAAGAICCLDLLDGKILWRASTSGRGRYATSPPRIAGDIVMVRYNGYRSIKCFGLDSGKLLAQWDARRQAEGRFSPEGILVTLIDGELAVRDPKRLDTPIWKRRYDAAKNPAVIAVTDGAVLVSLAQSGTDCNKAELLSITGGGRILAKFKTAEVKGAKCVPLEAVFDTDGVYLVCGTVISGMRGRRFGRLTYNRGNGSVQKFDPATGDLLWSRPILVSRQNSSWFVMPPINGRRHLAFLVNQQNPGMSKDVFLVDKATGKIVERIDLSGRGDDPVAEAGRLRSISSPAMTNGRLVVETAKGIVVYGGR